jgi:internalin A
MSELALERIKEAKEKRLTRLDLGNCGLTELPDALFELVWLEELYLCSGGRFFDLETARFVDFQSSNEVLVSDDNLSDNELAIKLFSKKALKSNNIKKISPEIVRLRKLKVLFINGYFSDEWLLSDLEPLSALENLEVLDVSLTEIDNLAPLKHLKNLLQLNISFTQVKSLDSLKHLTKLKTLNISSNRINDITALKPLENLQALDMVYTQINDLIPLLNKSKLNFLNLASTFVDDLNPLKDLPILQLDISSTLVSDISPLKNFIESGLIVTKETDRGDISVFNCPLVNPPRYIVEQGNKAILSYWYDLETKKSSINNQTKLIFIGNSRAGKTSLWQFLKDRIYKEQADSTHGIKTEIWDSETLETGDNQNLAAHIWDFGGQEYYHATHRLFLADNAVYILVWEKDSNKQGTRLEKFKLDDDPNGEIEEVDLEHFPASYWLDNIRYFGGTHCPVLIVQNKVDEEHLKANYTDAGQNIDDCFHLSVQNAYHFQEGNATLKRHDLKFQDFKERLLELLRKNATAFKLVKYYAQVREALEALAKEKEFITVSELKEIALGFDETPDLENLLAYLKSFTNTVLYFPQNPLLQDRLYLNPTHISRDIYKILNKDVRKEGGRFDIKHIEIRLNCNESEANRYVALMREFDLIFEKEDESGKINFIAPQYLIEYEAYKNQIEKETLRAKLKKMIQLKFDNFTPRSMMSRFISNNGALAITETYWKNGIIFTSPYTDLDIRVDYNFDNSIFTIWLCDCEKQATDLQRLVEQFEKLDNHSSIIKISNDETHFLSSKEIRECFNERIEKLKSNNGNYIQLNQFSWLKSVQSMTLKEFKNQVSNLIAKAKTKEAIDLVITWANQYNLQQLKDDMVSLQAELTNLKRNENLGLLNYEEVARTQARVINRILSFLSEIEEPVSQVAQSGDTPGQPLTTLQAKKTILFIASSPDGVAMANANRQIRSIQEALQRMRKEEFYDIKNLGFIQPSELIGEIIKNKPDFIHFFMHNDTVEGLFFENGNGDAILFNSTMLERLFERVTAQKKIDCVVLNACNTQIHKNAVSAFIPHVVYTTDFIPDVVEKGNNDTVASLFTRKFYEGVFSDKSYKDALVDANDALMFSQMPLPSKVKKKIEELYEIVSQ